MNNETSGFQLKAATYDKMKWFVTIVMPALTTLYLALDALWNFQYSHQTAGTMTAVTAFLGVVLGISSRNFKNDDSRFDGNIVVSRNDEGGVVYSLELNRDAGEIKDDNSILFKVINEAA